MTSTQSVSTVLSSGDHDAVAIDAPGRAPLHYGELRRHVVRTVGDLNRFGIGRGDRVGIVLDNGPEAASAFVSIASGATTAPLNPAYRRDELEFYLDDLGAKALVVAEGDEGPATAAADALGIQILGLRVEPDAPAGSFTLLSVTGDTVAMSASATPGLAGPDDVALVLHTSGTTSRPKIVPLLHRNIAATARNIRETLRLGPADRCMNVMPLFHIHGLMACVLSPLASGGSVFCTPGFNALRFFSWLDEAQPTWYSAVPTMHQAILARAPRNQASVDRARLRFIRSSSASLPVPVLEQLESVFGAPVVEAYAMTEASHQMTCNPLPPGQRKPGTVGPAAGPQVAIMDDRGTLLDPGQVGEIVIRGDNVTPGYENNPAANQANFTSGWFRTGDQGVIDDDGYVTVTGRLKEIINRGGEKVSPKEVDDVIMEHPAVEQVVTFGMPHTKLGEDVAAAVVLKEGHDADEAEIRGFVSHRVASFKVPRRVLIMDEIPKGPTGKLRRIGLAEILGLGS
jgi:acyl-CoA synthetase (AMP-forming)/AMP-acid ligase II